MCTMPRPYPREFREDVIRVARNREPDVRIKDIAKDFGISESCLTNWLTAADVEDGIKPGTTEAENAELRRREDPTDEVVVDRGSWLAFLAGPGLAERGPPAVRLQIRHTVRSHATCPAWRASSARNRSRTRGRCGGRRTRCSRDAPAPRAGR